jgi:polyketide synthase PksN
MLQLGARLIERVPALDAARDGDALLAAGSLGALCALIDGCAAPAAGAAPSDGVSLDAYARGQKQDRANRVVRRLRLESGEPLAVRARLVVDETHPFFFDHPLDHVSGLHLAEALSQVAKVACLYRHHLPADQPLALTGLRLGFPGLCAKDVPTEVEARLVEADPDVFEAVARQAGAVVATARLRLAVQDTDPPAAPPEGPAAAPVDRHAVNKRHGCNVLIGDLTADGDGARCRLVLDPRATFPADFPGPAVDGIVLAEAVRQCLRAVPTVQGVPDGTRGAEPPPDDTLGLLKDITLDLDRPVGRGEDIHLIIDRCAPLSVGGASLLELRGRVAVAGPSGPDAEAGRFSASAMTVSRALHRLWSSDKREAT